MPRGTPDRKSTSSASKSKPQSGPTEAAAREKESALLTRLLRMPMPFVRDPQPENNPQDGLASLSRPLPALPSTPP